MTVKDLKLLSNSLQKKGFLFILESICCFNLELKTTISVQN